MAIRFVLRKAGTAALRAFSKAVGLIYDSDDDKLKFLDDNGTSVRSVVTEDQTQTLTNKTLTTPIIDGVQSSALNDRQIITEAFPITGAALQAGVLAAVVFPAAAIIMRAVLDITTVSTGASTIDVGYTPTSATTESDTLLDGIDGNAAVGTFDSMNAALDAGANAKAQKAAAEKWVTVKSKTGDTTGLVGVLYVQYILA